MNKSAAINLVIGALCVYLFSSICHAQGDNNYNPMVNLGCLAEATVTGSLPDGAGRGIPEDVLWDPATNDWATVSDWHEYGMAFGDAIAATKENPLYWQIVWPTAKNVNYITCSGVYPNQPQQTTGWSVQIMVDDEWQDLAKAHNGWDADTLQGAGVGVPTQTNWLWDGQLVWRGLEPVVTTGIRFTVYANPDSLADGKESSADSLWSFAWSGRQLQAGGTKAVLIQYLDFSDATPDNKLDPLVNLALLDEAVVSANFQKGDSVFGEWIRNQPADILYDPVKNDYHNKNTPWGEFGYPYNYEAGYPEGPDDGFQYIIEWPLPKKINYFSWGGDYGGTPHPDTPWALQYWEGGTWQTLIDGIGGSLWKIVEHENGWIEHLRGDTLFPLIPGVDADAHSILTVPEEDAITTNKIRLAAWSDLSPLWSFAIRARGGESIYNHDSENPFKAVLVQYAEISDPTTAIETNDLINLTDFTLHQNYPNPFNPKTIINYELPITNDVELTIYNLMGQKVETLVSAKQNAGVYRVEWDASDLSSGIYTYRLTAGNFHKIKKMVLVK